MLLPLFMTCDTLNFSHTVGCVNSPWQAIFIYERYLHGLGFTEKAYKMLDQILPRVLDNIRNCPCNDGCPCCVGKPLRQFTTWSVERGEGSIPSKTASRMILEGLLGDGANLEPDGPEATGDSEPRSIILLEQSLRRRLERMREPKVFHPITPGSKVSTGYPDTEKEEELATPDVTRRSERRRGFDRDLHKRIARKIRSDKLDPLTAEGPRPPEGKGKTGHRSTRGFSRPSETRGPAAGRRGSGGRAEGDQAS